MDEGGSRSFRAALGEFATALGRAIHASEESVAHAVRVFERLSGPWAELPLGDRPPWPNDICDDGSPFELSAAFNDGRTELRMLVEPQEAPFTLASNWKAGLAVNDALAQHEGASLERFARIAPLFAPEEGDDAVFALWHAAVLESTGESLFKAYVNPRIHGAARAPSLVREALVELGLEKEAALVERLVGDDGDALRYFSLDLAATETARVKIYVARSDSARAVERLVEPTRNFDPGLASELLYGLTGHLGPFNERPILVCFAFDGKSDAPVGTLHVPIRCYCPNDEAVLARIMSKMDATEATMLHDAVRAIAPGPLRECTGVITYASFRPGPRAIRTTAYLAPMLYRRRIERTRRDSSAPSAIV